MSEKWTKSPWHVEIGEDEDYGVAYICHPETVCTDTVICDLKFDNNENALWNAHLMSAAPEMYDLICALLEYIDAIPSEVAAKFPTMPGISRDWVEAVAAKARGES